jgi:hypothetical protein
MPGAGGGGGAAIGDNAIGGDGGDGGDSASAILDVTPGDTFLIEIGKGGKLPTLPGQHGGGGGDTTLRIRGADGNLERTIRVKGGTGGKAGTLPEGAMQISEDDLANGFQISTLLLANAMDFREGLLFIIGGGWNKFQVSTLPCDAVWHVVCTASWKSLEPSASRWLQLCVLDPQGTEVSRIAIEIRTEQMAEQSVHWIRSIGAPIDSVGVWTVHVESGGFVLCQIPVKVMLQNY